LAERVARARRRLLPAGLALLAAAGAACSARPVQAPPAVAIEREFEYVRRDDGPLHADVYRPPGDGPFPGVLLVHGGAWRRGDKSRMARIAERLVLHGYVAVSIDYRLAPAHRFPAQLEDCRAALRWMEANAARLGLDPARLAGFGYSAGGHLVGLLATENEPDGAGDDPSPAPRLRAGVLGGAPVALLRLPANGVVEDLLGARASERPDLYDLASPLHFVTPDDPPLFLYHGALDRIVDPSQPQLLLDALERAHVPSAYYEAPGGHFATFFRDDESVRRAIAFLDRWLRADATGAPR